MTAQQLDISLIIACYNGGGRIGATLCSLLGQTLSAERWEAVVVDNNSSDNTAEVVEGFIAAHPEVRVRLVSESKQGLSHARNCGIDNSSGAIVAIIDDDELAAPTLLADYVAFFESHPGVVAAGGRIVANYPTGKPTWMTSFTERPIAGILDLGEVAIPFPAGKYFGGGNMALRRTAIERYGKFNPELGRRGTTLLGGEEKELYGRLVAGGEVVYYLPTAYIEHIIPSAKLTREYFEAVCHRIGQSERIRTLELGRKAYRRRWLDEVVKWCATLVLCLLHTLSLCPSKARYLWIMRRQISRGLAGK